MRSQFNPPCVIPVQLNRPQLSIFNDCWSRAKKDRPTSFFQPCNKQLNITNAKIHGDLSLQTEGETSESGHFGCSLGFIVWVLAENDKALQDGGDGEVLLCGQLRPLSMSQQHRCGVSLETCDGLWLACLAHNIHSLDKDCTHKHMRHRVILL